MNSWRQPGTILVTCPKGLPPYLKAEMEALGCPEPRELAAGVETRGTLADCPVLNLRLRTGHRVLFELARLRAPGPAELYAGATALPWEELIPSDGYVSVSSALRTQAVNDSRFANQRLKDAIVDRIAARMGRRPDSGPDQSRSCVFLHWREDEATIYLDTSGEPLARRGYRTMPGSAPMQETLAAAVLLAAGWPEIADTGGNLVNPMCGSGTLAIEAGLMALGRAPGLTRDNFAFMHLLGYDPGAWEALRQEARAAVLARPQGRLLASDIDPAQVKAARHNAGRAGLGQHLGLAVCDFRQAEVPLGAGLVVVNPEYGMRLGQTRELEATYKALGDFLKQRCAGYRAALFTGNPDLAKHVGLKPSRRIPFWNAKIECRLLLFELYAGSRRASRQPA